MQEKENARRGLPASKTRPLTSRAKPMPPLKWGETPSSFFMFESCGDNKETRVALAARVQERPDDAGAWRALLEHATASSTAESSSSLLRLYRRATQSIPKDRPELKESEAYVSIWLGYAQCQLSCGRRDDALEAFRYMRNEGIGKRNATAYRAWAACEASAGRASAARDALQMGLRSVPAPLRGDLTDLAAIKSEEALLAALSLSPKETEAQPESSSRGGRFDSTASKPTLTQPVSDAPPSAPPENWSAAGKQTFSSYRAPPRENENRSTQAAPTTTTTTHTATHTVNTTASSVGAATAFYGDNAFLTAANNNTHNSSRPSASKMMTRDDINYMLKWQPGGTRTTPNMSRPEATMSRPETTTKQQQQQQQQPQPQSQQQQPQKRVAFANNVSSAVPTPAAKQAEPKGGSKSTSTSSSSRRRSGGSSSSVVDDSSSSDDDTPSRRAKAQARARLAEATRDLGVPTAQQQHQQARDDHQQQNHQTFGHRGQQQQQQQQQQQEEASELSSKAEAFLDLVSEKNLVVVADRAYAKLALIGRGGSSKVFKVLDADGQILALKRIRLKGPESRENLVGYANEITLLRRLSGKPGIIALLAAEVDVDAGSINMIMEAGEADLATVLAQRSKDGDETSFPPLSHGNFLRLAWQQMLEAVNAIHDERIVHGDLKPANFLFVQGRLRLIDFGIARAIKNDTTNIYRDTQIGTLNYMSPEAIRDTNIKGATSSTNTTTTRGGPSSSFSPLGGQQRPGVSQLGGRGLPLQRGGPHKPKMRVGRASDVWSLGCILYQMVYGKTPFGHLHLYAKLQAIANPFHEIDLPEAPLASEDALDCLRGCLQREPSARPDINDGLLRHRFLEPPTDPPPDVTTDNIQRALDAAFKQDPHLRRRLSDQEDPAAAQRDLAEALHASLVAQRLEDDDAYDDQDLREEDQQQPLPENQKNTDPSSSKLTSDQEHNNDLRASSSTTRFATSAAAAPPSNNPGGFQKKNTQSGDIRAKRTRRRSIVDRRDNRMRSLREEDEDADVDHNTSLDGAEILGLAVSSSRQQQKHLPPRP